MHSFVIHFLILLPPQTVVGAKRKQIQKENVIILKLK